MFFILSLLLLLSLSDNTYATEVIRHYSFNDESEHHSKMSPKNFNLQKNGSREVIHLDEEKYDNSVLASHYAHKAEKLFKENNVEKATEAYIRAIWAGDEETLNFIESLLSDRKISDYYNVKDKKNIIKYFDPVYKKLAEENKKHLIMNR